MGSSCCHAKASWPSVGGQRRTTQLGELSSNPNNLSFQTAQLKPNQKSEWSRSRQGHVSRTRQSPSSARPWAQPKLPEQVERDVRSVRMKKVASLELPDAQSAALFRPASRRSYVMTCFTPRHFPNGAGPMVQHLGLEGVAAS